ncbi:SDR family NAD(P)-dependent oxidoreductase [Candidatus Woesearchaeota archaeon]|nr:SDR family NAD(P)-dependent oxidoreductase [Candidatus Woesearchaeota archaeon]
MYRLGSLSGKSVLVTGGLGFIGSTIARRAVSLGAKVTIYDACLDPYGWNFANIKEIKGKVNFVRADVRDFNKLKQHVKGKDIIFDCAAQVSHTLSMSNPLLDLDINCLGALNLLEACRRHNDSAKIIYASSRGVIGTPKTTPVDELHPENPADVQGINKLAAEKYYMLYHGVYGLKTTALRISNAYGPRAQVKTGDYAIVNWFIKRALSGEPLVVFGDGSQTRDYIYVDDISDAMLLAAQSEKSGGEIFMLGSGKETRFIDVVKLIVGIVGKGEIVRRPWPPERKAIEIGRFVVSTSKIRRILGWRPKTSLKEGMKRTVEFYRQRLKEYL